MHLVINATEIGRRRGGNESYLRGLVQGLEDLNAPSKVTLLLTAEGMEAIKGSVSERFACQQIGVYRRIFFYLWQQTTILRRLRPDWYLSTFFLPPITPCRAAVLVHDLSFRAHPEFYPASIALYMRLLTGWAIHQAERIIALSEFTQQELARFFPASTTKTVVVYPGVGRSFHPQSTRDNSVLRALGLAPGYILAIGNIHPRKNLSRLLDAYECLGHKRADIPPMVWVGLQRWRSEGLVERALATGVVLPGFVTEDDLPALCRQALMLVYPSLYEGFGLPPLEAMACGTPVIASNSTGLPEAVGESALLVDPSDVEALASSMERLMDDGSLQEALRRRGIRRAQQLTWTRTAEKLLTALA